MENKILIKITTMITIGISCSHCNTETLAEIMSATHANCFVCAKPHSITENEYAFVKRDITPLHVIEQRAKDQAVIDMWLDDQLFIDWSTCFDTDNIRVAI